MKTFVTLAAALFGLVASADAQDQQSFKTIIGKGFEIKSVTFARGDSTDNREIFVVTLQKEKSVAVCYFRRCQLDQSEHRHARGFEALRRA